MTKKQHDNTEDIEFDKAAAAAEMAEHLVAEEGSKKAVNNEKVEIELTADEKIVELEAKISELNDNNLRMRAEFDNYRKRTVKDIAAARFNSQLSVVTPFLSVFEHFKMAMKVADSAENFDSLVQGMKMISSEFSKALDDLDVKCFDAVGQKFDPMKHEAVGHENSDDIEEGIVVKQWSAGYTLGEKLLRPAMVIVSSGKVIEEENK
ncbi:nucleotide exchange factor GrpE [Lentisphaerota bacterium WC36G]|nr:nucleotide exchange factor GrpE [Lentisphaerae bacterium WC36]